MKKVNITINPEIHTNAKIIAILKKIKLNDYFHNAIKEAVRRDRKLLERLKGK
jgi:predicted HicB family RNase H-like nuclease